MHSRKQEGQRDPEESEALLTDLNAGYSVCDNWPESYGAGLSRHSPSSKASL